MLDQEFKYFIDHQAELVEKFNGKVIVVVGESVVGSYDSELDAYIESKRKYSPWTFLVQRCVPGESAYRQSFHSRVVLQ